MIENNEHSVCATCGQCCKWYAGWYAPHQVKDVLMKIKAGDTSMLGTAYQIDCWEAEGPVLVLRPAHKNSLGRKMDFSWGGECANLTENGCIHPFEDRPVQCQTLKPDPFNPGSGCNGSYSKEKIKEMWNKPEFQEILNSI